MELEKNFLGRYKINKKDADSKIIMTIGLIGFLLAMMFFISTETRWDSVIHERWQAFIGGILRFTDTSGDQFITILKNLFFTILIAAAVTISTLLTALPLAIYGSKNLYKGFLPNFVKAFSAIIRAVPTIVWAFIFIPIFGLNIGTAFLGMTFHSLAFFLKSFSESFEEVDPGITEALTATGAGKHQIAYSAIMPASFKKIVGWVLLRLEINIAVVIVVAPAIGVPNSIGYLIFVYYGAGLYGQLGLTFFLIVVSMLSIEKLSHKVLKSL